MIKRIERPDWMFLEALVLVDRAKTLDSFNKWFDQTCEPINKAIDSAVEVYTHLNRRDRPEDGYIYYSTNSEPQDTHKALLINIEPIKQETCAEVLAEIVRLSRDIRFITKDAPILERAKAALEREK